MVETSVPGFSEDQAGQCLDALLAASQRVNQAMRTQWGEDGLGNRLDALLAADDAAAQFTAALKPLLPNAATLGSEDCLRVYPVLRRLLAGRANADTSASWGLIIQASCITGCNLAPEGLESEDAVLGQQINDHLDQRRQMLDFIDALDALPAGSEDLVARLRRQALPPNSVPCQILGMVMAMSEKVRGEHRDAAETT